MTLYNYYWKRLALTAVIATLSSTTTTVVVVAQADEDNSTTVAVTDDSANSTFGGSSSTTTNGGLLQGQVTINNPLSSFNTSSVNTANSSVLFDDCDPDVYYADLIAEYGSDPTAWPRSAVAQLVKSTHRNMLPNTASIRGDDDILLALIDLDFGDTNDGTTVHLIYRDLSFPALPAGNPNTWQREDLWPLDRGLPRNSTGLTDVHAKRPADSTVRLKKASLFFGTCGTVEDNDSCKRPATIETAPDTEQDNKIFAPPIDARGDVARALFYTALRYNDDFGLELTDCPPFASNQFGYLSELLNWAAADNDVTEAQIARNDRACARWQGNRNPFVDYPQLVETYFGTPNSIIGDTNTYQGCSVPTNAPTATPNDCSSLKAGDLPFFVVNSDAPDQFLLFPLAEISPAVESIFVTDNAWNGTQFVGDEGVLEFIIPEEGVQAGRSFGYGPGSPLNANWEAVEGTTFDLNINGDQVLVYCVDADGKPNFLWGFNFAGGDWAEEGLDDYGTNSSALPTKLQDLGHTTLPEHFDNCLYTGVQSGRKDELQLALMNSTNYQCSDEARFDVDLSSWAYSITTSSNFLVSLLVALVPLAMMA